MFQDLNNLGEIEIIISLYINENIPCRSLNKHPKFPNTKLIAFELHQSKGSRLVLDIYKPPCQNDTEFLN